MTLLLKNVYYIWYVENVTTGIKDDSISNSDTYCGNNATRYFMTPRQECIINTSCVEKILLPILRSRVRKV